MSRFSLGRPGALRVAAALVATLPAAAQASPLLELTGDLGGPGGLVARHTGPGAFSTYFNPALLPAATPGLSLRVVALADRIDVRPHERTDASTRVPESAAGAFRDPENLTPVTPSPLPTDWLERGCQSECNAVQVSDPARARPRQGDGSSDGVHTYAGLGLVQPLLGDRVTFGLAALIPTASTIAARSFYNDEREQYFSNSLHPELYADRLTPLSLAFGVGSEVIDRLRVGASFTLNLDNRAMSPTYVPAASEYETLSLSNRVEVDTSVAPHFGITYEPLDRLVLSGTLHTEQSLRVRAAFSSFLPDGSEQFAARRFTHHFVPMSASLGASWGFEFDGQEIDVVAGTTYERWSTYRDRHDAQPSGVYAWEDRLHPSAGVRHRTAEWTSGLDATWFRSPVPEQTGRSNYVDNDRVGTSALVERLFAVAGVSFTVGVGLQAHRLLARSHDKRIPRSGSASTDLVLDEVPDDAVEKLDITEPVEPRTGLQTNNPGFPGFSSDGWVMAGSVNATLLY